MWQLLCITDHANFPIPSFWENLEESKRLHEEYNQEGFYLGVELTTIPKTMYENCVKTGRRDTYTSTNVVDKYDLEFMLTIRYRKIWRKISRKVLQTVL